MSNLVQIIADYNALTKEEKELFKSVIGFEVKSNITTPPISDITPLIMPFVSPLVGRPRQPYTTYSLS